MTFRVLSDGVGQASYDSEKDRILIKILLDSAPGAVYNRCTMKSA